MRKSSHKRQKLLCYTKLPNTGLLGLRQEAKEGDNLFAEQLGLSRVGQPWSEFGKLVSPMFYRYISTSLCFRRAELYGKLPDSAT